MKLINEKETKCLTEDDFRKYMKSYIDTTNMTTKDYMTIILYMNHIRNCERCDKTENDLMHIMESASSEEEFWAKFNEHWQNKEEKDLSDIDIKSSPRR